jgi:mRNA-degrading endonuclease YafQ of YafQ-DinJ toxin-antitoxin module
MPIVKKSPYFQKKTKKLLKNNLKLILLVAEKIQELEIKPKMPGLKSNKVNTPKFGECYSSRVTGDIRIIWKFGEDGEIEIIELLDIGVHDEVY